MACAITRVPSKQPQTGQLESGEPFDRLDEWLLRSRKALHYVSKLILGSSELAATAVERCQLRALEDFPSFECEGPFRSWILRVLIDEALWILHRDHPSASKEVEASDQHTAN